MKRLIYKFCIRFIFFLSVLILFSITILWVRTSKAEAQNSFSRVPLQYIAALGDPNSSSGFGAEKWGHWPLDPGPRGVWIKDYSNLKAAGGMAPARWKFDDSDWWLEEHGLIMEKPNFPLAAGKYVVTGGRKVSTILTIYPPDQEGVSRWELDKGAKLKDVTHLPCRAARYVPSKDNILCLPSNADQSFFPVKPGSVMPDVEGCSRQDYFVLFVLGIKQ